MPGANGYTNLNTGLFFLPDNTDSLDILREVCHVLVQHPDQTFNQFQCDCSDDDLSPDVFYHQPLVA